ncbi:MAG: precorrin-3B C(17)-methyltransferase [Chloroflexales bacterium]|nr:precorrin-3B C(17)-methyltransferase [Chloroflexales bacterium]
MSAGTVVIIAVTRAGARLAARLAPALGAVACVPPKLAAEAPDAALHADSALDEVRARWREARALVLIMAAGIAVRAIAPLLEHKANDPAVLCLDEAGRFVVPLLGGHRAGANELAHRIAALTGGQAAITTASDVQGLPALDQLGQAEGWLIDEESALTHAMACLVNGEPLGCYVEPALPWVRMALEDWLAACPTLSFVADPAELREDRYAAALLVTHRSGDEHWSALRPKTVRYLLPALVAGVGCRRGVPAEELYDALMATLDDAGLGPRCVAALATAELKADEPGLIALAEAIGTPLEVIPTAQLATLDPAAFSPSAATEHFDLPGVAEPCALLAANGPLIVPKRAFARCTVAVALKGGHEEALTRGDEETRRRGDEEIATHDAQAPSPQLSAASSLRRIQSSPHRHTGRLTLIGIGPGNLDQLTMAAREALQSADLVAGYQVYIDLVHPLLAPHQELIVTPAMGDELGRARQAIELAKSGRRVALISSGDIGIYAMAGPVFEQLGIAGWTGDDPTVEVLPGISAFQALAARLGAPISHDFCLISLSDLLTPWTLIERRVAAAAATDFVVAFYNPRSRKRHWQLGAALDLLREQRPATTPVAIARNITRADEHVTLTTLAEIDPDEVDMFTLVLIGNSRSYSVGERMVTPRGYQKKRGAEEATRWGDDDTMIWGSDGAARRGCQDATMREENEARRRESDDAETPGAEEIRRRRSDEARMGERAPSIPSTHNYPIILTQMAGALAVVVGGGAVGERKVRGLLASGMNVHLISPAVTSQLSAWAEAGRIGWVRRGYASGDLAGARLVFAATDQRAVNALVAREAAAEGILCNVADAPGEGSFHVPALYRTGGMTVAVSSSGAAPARTVALRDAIARWLEASAPGGDNER